MNIRIKDYEIIEILAESDSSQVFCAHRPRSIKSVVLKITKADVTSRNEVSRFRRELEYIPNMLFVKDASTLKFMKFNKAGEKSLGYSPDELPDKIDHDIFPHEQSDYFTSRDREIIENKESLYISEDPISTRHICHSMRHTIKIPIYADDGMPLNLPGVSEDIAEHKQAKAEIHRLNAEFEQRNIRCTAQPELANQEHENFLYSASHDLRTPLRAIDGFSQILLEDYVQKLDEEGKRLIDKVHTNTTNMGQLIDDILQFSFTGRLEMMLSEVDKERL